MNKMFLVITMAVTAVECCFADQTSKVWNGSVSDSWDAAENWSPAGIPNESDNVVIADATVAVGHAICVGSLSITGTSKVTFQAATFEGESTAENLYANATVVKAMQEFVVDGSSVVTVANDPVTGAPVKLVCASFRLGANAVLTADEKGWAWYAGTGDEYKRFVSDNKVQTRAMGPGNSYGNGAGYGAKGGGNYGGAAYGFEYAPFLPGSPNGAYGGNLSFVNYGGGTVWVKCDGTCELYGTITANGTDKNLKHSDYGAGSGGGVWICAKSLKAASSTSVSAIGGYLGGGYQSLGAGGRISLALSCSDDALDALAAGRRPEELTYAEGIEFFAASAQGGLKTGTPPTYGNDGTITTVTGPSSSINVTISGSPVNATGVMPAYGIESFEEGTKQVFTAPEYGIDPIDSLIRYPCLGYEVTDANGLVKRGEGLSVEVEIANPPLTVTWRWGAKQARALLRKPEHGSLTVDGVAVDGDAILWPSGRLASVAVVPDAGYEFVCWEGNVPLRMAQANPLSAELTEPIDVVPVLRLVEDPTIRVWKANAVGDWKTVENWEPAGIPGAADVVVVNSGTVVFSNCLEASSLEVSGGTVKIASVGNVNGMLDISGDVTLTGGLVELGYGSTWKPTVVAGMSGRVCLAVGGDLKMRDSAELAVHAGPVKDGYTFATGCSFVEVAGALKLEGSSKLLPYSDYMTGGSVKISAKSVSVAVSAKVDARGKGFNWLDNNTPPDAPGVGNSYNVGASHGGIGGGNIASSTYDNLLAPLMPGSPNGAYSTPRPGGGVIRIHARAMSIDGTLDARAEEPSNMGGASGGSIWLTANKYKFGANAVLTARGADSGYSAFGGGGRIAIGRWLGDGCIAELAATGTWQGVRPEYVKDEEAFRVAFGNETMTLDAIWGGDDAQTIVAKIEQARNDIADITARLEDPSLTDDERKSLEAELQKAKQEETSQIRLQGKEPDGRGSFAFVDADAPGLIIFIK